MITNFSKQTIENSCKILELMLEVSIECQLTLDTYSFEGVKNIHLLYILISKGEVLLTSVDELQQNSELEITDICNEIYQKELEVPSFAQKMCLLRRKMAQEIYDSSNDTSMTCQFNAFLDKLIHVLKSRNLDIYNLFLEENFASTVSSPLEVEYVAGMQNYIENVGWESIPLGEREESILCICYHYCTQGYYLEALELVSSSIESGLSNYLIYFCYFRLSIKCQKFDEAIQVYNTMIQLMPSCAILPTDRYHIEKILSDNFQETAYQGRDLYTEITILVKVLKSPPPEVLQNINQHGKAKHSKILEVLDIRETIFERPAIVCEYFEGISLEKYIEQEKGFSFSMWEEISMQILGAMAHVHDLGIFHGNITPKNILFDGKNVKICNLGFYGTQFWGEKLSIKNFAEIAFYAPESLTNGETTFYSDVYSLGKLLYYLFAGYVPTGINGQVPISEFFEKSTSNIKEERYENAEEMLKNFAEKVQTAKSTATKSESTKNTTSFFSPKTNTNISLPEGFTVRNNEIICEKDGGIMVLIPEGLFFMGSEERNSESPVHEVFLDSYLIDKYPVTNKQYMKFLNDVGRIGVSKVAHPKQNKTTNFVPKHWNTPQYNQYSNSPNHPVIFVDWWDAWAYANWAGKELPTEAEWEKAARGNDQRIYPWGNQPPTDKFANFGGNIGHTTPIGSYPESMSPYGCSDMSGNIWEWCVDTYDAFFYQNRNSNNNPVNIIDKPSRSLRGGSWNDAASSIRTTVRGCWMNIVRYGYIGFRCVYKLNKEQ